MYCELKLWLQCHESSLDQRVRLHPYYLLTSVNTFPSWWVLSWASGPSWHAFQVTCHKHKCVSFPHKCFDLKDTAKKLSSQKRPQLGANQQSGIVKDFSKGMISVSNCLPASCFRMTFTTLYSTYEHQVVHDKPRKQRGTFMKSS